jgi:hypothetical protein
MVVLALAFLPGLELACDAGGGNVHPYEHLHMSWGLSSRSPIIAPDLVFARLGTSSRRDPLSGTGCCVFVPPRI